MESLEKALEHTSSRLEDLVTKVLPAMAQHQADVATELSTQILDIDVHRRKWNLVVQGLPGPANETEEATRAACVSFAKDALKISNASDGDFSACHRLKQVRDAPVIVRFVDLAKRNAWVSNARNLRDGHSTMSVTPDLPPVLRTVKTELLNQRRTMPEDLRRRSRIRYIPRWPYVELKQPNMDPLRPTCSKLSVVTKALNNVSPRQNIEEYIRNM